MIVSISNQKGGVGKTTTVVNLAGSLVQEGKKVLVIDIDPQGNMTDSLLSEQPKHTIYNLLTSTKNCNEIIVKRSEALHVIPSNIELAGAVFELSSQAGREYILKEKLQNIIKNYDYIIIDTPPDLSILSQNAWTVSDSIIIPVQTEYYALQGVKQLVETIEVIKKRLNPNLKVAGLLATLYDSRRAIHKEVLGYIRTSKIPSYNVHIRMSTKLSEAPAHHKTILEYAPKDKGAKDYLQLSKELKSRKHE